MLYTPPMSQLSVAVTNYRVQIIYKAEMFMSLMAIQVSVASPLVLLLQAYGS